MRRILDKTTEATLIEMGVSEPFGNELKAQLKALMEPIRQFCIDNHIQSCMIPFEDEGWDSFSIDAPGKLAPHISPVLCEYGSIYVKLHSGGPCTEKPCPELK
jgi:hypothetical protein